MERVLRGWSLYIGPTTPRIRVLVLRTYTQCNLTYAQRRSLNPHVQTPSYAQYSGLSYAQHRVEFLKLKFNIILIIINTRIKCYNYPPLKLIFSSKSKVENRYG